MHKIMLNDEMIYEGGPTTIAIMYNNLTGRNLHGLRYATYLGYIEQDCGRKLVGTIKRIDENGALLMTDELPISV